MSKTPTYQKLFDPTDNARLDSTPTDLRDGSIYHWTEELRLATEVALVTGRPLLLKGEPGGGKSSWAAYVARNLGWRYFDQVVTAKTQAQDLLYQFDLLRRLNDAQAQQPLPGNDHYIVPGMLWWAFDPEGAAKYPVGNPAKLPHEEVNQKRNPQHAVLLIDEIDKADPDLPNGLLVPLGSQTFHVPELGKDVKRADTAKGKDLPAYHSPLVIFSSNSERALPQAFLRRCVVLTLPRPDAATLIAVARLHHPNMKEAEAALAEDLADQVMTLRKEAKEHNERKPGIAEYLDALRACLDLNITLGSKEWELLRQITFQKERTLDNE